MSESEFRNCGNCLHFDDVKQYCPILAMPVKTTGLSIAHMGKTAEAEDRFMEMEIRARAEAVKLSGGRLPL